MISAVNISSNKTSSNQNEILSKQRSRMKIYQPMPTTKANSLLDHTLQTHQNTLCSVVPRHDNLRMPRKNRQLFVATFIAERVWLHSQHLATIYTPPPMLSLHSKLCISFLSLFILVLLNNKKINSRYFNSWSTSLNKKLEAETSSSEQIPDTKIFGVINTYTASRYQPASCILSKDNQVEEFLKNLACTDCWDFKCSAFNLYKIHGLS